MSTEEEKPPRIKRETPLFPIAIWKKMSIAWKTGTLMVLLLGAGASAYGYVNRFAVHEDVSQLRSETSKADQELREQMKILSESQAATSSSVRAIEAATANVRDDMRTLLQHMLAQPPRRRSP